MTEKAKSATFVSSVDRAVPVFRCANRKDQHRPSPGGPSFTVSVVKTSSLPKEKKETDARSLLVQRVPPSVELRRLSPSRVRWSEGGGGGGEPAGACAQAAGGGDGQPEADLHLSRQRGGGDREARQRGGGGVRQAGGLL
eukprot:446994-Prorocentrum_minimum.AAC.3